MQAIFSPNAEDDLDKIDEQLKKFFLQHAEKISKMPPRRHLKSGVPFNVEDVTKQARLIYKIEGDVLKVLRCFALHKDYEKWCASFR